MKIYNPDIFIAAAETIDSREIWYACVAIKYNSILDSSYQDIPELSLFTDLYWKDSCAPQGGIWWPKVKGDNEDNRDYESRIYALLLAAEIAKDKNNKTWYNQVINWIKSKLNINV